MEFSDKLYNAMERAGVFIEGNIDWRSREFQRFSSKKHYNRKKHLFVILLNGGASFGDWRDPTTWYTIWDKSIGQLTVSERHERKRELERLKAEQQLIKNHAIWRASELLNHQTWRGKTCTETKFSHPYVIKKKIVPYYGRQIRSYIVLPIMDVNRNLISLQYIKPDGFKQFKKNASPKEGMVFLCEPLPMKYEGIIYICEGYATGCSIYEAVGPAVVCTLSASNLVPATMKLRTKYPLAQFKICADNDCFNKENIGLNEGKKAAKLSGGTLHYPFFNNNLSLLKPTDFNDLFSMFGIEEVQNQLEFRRFNSLI